MTVEHVYSYRKLTKKKLFKLRLKDIVPHYHRVGRDEVVYFFEYLCDTGLVRYRFQKEHFAILARFEVLMPFHFALCNDWHYPSTPTDPRQVRQYQLKPGEHIILTDSVTREQQVVDATIRHVWVNIPGNDFEDRDAFYDSVRKMFERTTNEEAV